MKIVYFTESLLPHVDGVSVTLAQLFSTLESCGVDFGVFSPFRPEEDVSWRRRVRQVRSFTFPLYRDYRVSLPYGHDLDETLDRDRPDLIHVVSPTPMAIWAQRYADRRGIPVVASFHTHFVSYFRYYGVRALEELGWTYLSWFYNRCEAVYAPSPSIIRELAARGIEGLELWSRGVDVDRFSPAFRDEGLRRAVGADEDDTPLVLLVSRLVKEKDLHDLVAMDRILRAGGRSFRLALVGDGPLRDELEEALPDAHFAGHQTGAALARWYASADVFVFPSTTETLGNVVLEALASGVPAVVVDRGGPPGLVDAGRTGRIARPNDPADLADAVADLLDDPDGRRRMGRAARQAMGPREWTTINRGLLDSYRRVIAGSEAPAAAERTA